MRVFVCLLAVVILLSAGVLIGRHTAVPLSPNPSPAATDLASSPAPLAPAPAVPANASTAPVPSDPEQTQPAGISLLPATHDFGNLLEGEARTCTLNIARPADSTLTLGRLYSSCQCITVNSEKRQFTAKEQAAVTVAIHTLSLEGRKSFPIYVEVVAPVKGVLRGEVTTTVQRVAAKVTLLPDALHFGTVHGGKTTSCKVLNLTKQPLSIRPPVCSLKDIKVTVLEGSVIGPGQAVTVSAEISAAGLKPGPIQGVVSLATDCPGHAVIEIPIDGTALGNTTAK